MANVAELEKRIDDLEECVVNINEIFKRILPALEAVPQITDDLARAIQNNTKAIGMIAGITED